MPTIDYLIVGQGIAGTVLSHTLLKEGKHIVVIDAGSEHTPSLAAGAIINPVTGRKTLKSWKVDELLPFAKSVYQEMGQLLGTTVAIEMPIHKYFSHPADQDAITPAKLTEIADHAHQLKAFDPAIKLEYGGIEIKTSSWVDGRKLLTEWRKYLLTNMLLVTEQFDYNALTVLNDGVSYKGIDAKKAIFCEGSQMAQNPWFKQLPLNTAKGEALIIEMPGLSQHHIILKGIFLLPIGNQQFYVGSTNQWNTQDPAPTDQKREELEAGIRKITNLPYKVLEHLSGIRPNVKDRRPLLGIHPTYPSLAVFNGMGTKGFSLSPWCAQIFVDHLERNVSLERELDISRFG